MGACMKLGGQGDVYDFGGHARCHTTFLDTASGIVFPADLYENAFVKRRVASGMCVCVCVCVC